NVIVHKWMETNKFRHNFFFPAVILKRFFKIPVSRFRVARIENKRPSVTVWTDNVIIHFIPYVDRNLALQKRKLNMTFRAVVIELFEKPSFMFFKKSAIFWGKIKIHLVSSYYNRSYTNTKSID